MNFCLPEIRKEPLIPEYFPTKMQAFIFRNWEMVHKATIAKVLSTTISNVEKEAVRMGLKPQENTEAWGEKGYISIIRSNWSLLPYSQLVELLGWNEEKLALVLKEEDFLDYKLGRFKPNSKKIVYNELTDEEIEETMTIKNIMRSIYSLESDNSKEAFDFWTKKEEKVIKKNPQKGMTIVNNEWSIINRTGSDIVEGMINRFVCSTKEKWGYELDTTKKYNKIIELLFAENNVEEYHEIIIEERKITIKGGNSAGLLRGLYRLEELSIINGGTYFEKGAFIRRPRFGARYIYSFCGLYEKALDVDSSTYCPDSLLEKYARVGVNGIWLQGVLYRIVEFPYAPEMSEGSKERIRNLKAFAKRAEKYGIKIFLYINEPRAMPLSFFKNCPELKGSEHGHFACMCLSEKSVQDYLHTAIQSICKSVPELGGLFTITMSENPTHCKSINVDVPCKKCKNLKTWELSSMVNNIIARAAHSINPQILVIAWDWGWDAQWLGANEESTVKCIEATDKDVIIMTKRETKIPFTRGGVNGVVQDYSISVDGLSKQSIKTWEIAKNTGHNTAIKLQVNNTWECSTTPYLPVYRTLFNQIKSVLSQEIDHLMLSWTLGGYPSPSIKLISNTFFIENNKTDIDFDDALKLVYGDKAECVKKATDIFCMAFKEFPFDIQLAYNGPQNGGVSNPLYHKPTGYSSTMTCFAYDDVKSWSGIYTPGIIEKQFEKLSDKWKEGLELLSDIDELKDISYISYSLFKSSYNQIKFVRLRDKYISERTDELKKEILDIINNEKAIAFKVYEIMSRRPEIGFEAANHYYFSKGNIAEKIINCEWLKEYYEEL